MRQLILVFLSVISLSVFAQTSVPLYAELNAVGTNNYTGSFPQKPELVNGLKFIARFQNANTGAVTLDLNGYGAKAVKNGTNELINGEILSSKKYWLSYDGTNFQIVGSSGGGSGAGFTNPMTTNGDLITQSSGSPTRIAIGTLGQVLTTNVSGLPVWSSPNTFGSSTITTTGSNVTASANRRYRYIYDGSFALATASIAFPGSSGSLDGDIIEIVGGVTTLSPGATAVTSLTVTAGSGTTISPGYLPTTLLAGERITWSYSNFKWTIVNRYPEPSSGGSILPSQTGNVDKSLTTNGASASWVNNNANDNGDIGVIINEAWSNTSAWTNSGGATFSATGGVLTVNGGSPGGPQINNYLYSNYGISCYGQYDFEIPITVGTINSSSYGVGIGPQGANGFSPLYSQFFVDLSTSSDRGYLKVIAQSAVVGKSDVPLTVSTGDVLNYKLSFNYGQVTFSVYNATTKEGNKITLNGRDIVSVFLDKNAYAHAIFAMGGTHTAGAATVTVREKKRPDWLIIGDSFTIIQGLTQNDNYVTYLKNNVHDNIQVYAGGGNRVQDLNISEILAIAPKNILWQIGTNNKGNGDSDATLISRMNSAFSSLTGYTLGTNLFIMEVAPRADMDVSGTKVQYATSFPASSLVKTYNALVSPSGYAMKPAFVLPDGVHPNKKGHAYIASILTNSLPFRRKVTPSFTQPEDIATGLTNPISLTGGGGGTDFTYLGNYLDQGIFTQNFNPVTGAISNLGKAAAFYYINGKANDGSHHWTFSSTNGSANAEGMHLFANGDFVVGNTSSIYGLKVTQSGVVTMPNYANGGGADQMAVFDGTTGQIKKQAIPAGSSSTIITDASTARTLTNSDDKQIIRFTNSLPITVTLDNGLNANFTCTIIKAGTGDISFSAVGTLTTPSPVIQVQGSAAVAQQYTTNTWEVLGSLGPPSAVGITELPDATDADFTMSVNASKYLPAATLTQNRTITIPSGSNGDVMEFYNNETGFSWLLSGVSIYLSDNTTVITQLLANTNYIIKKKSGKWRISN